MAGHRFVSGALGVALLAAARSLGGTPAEDPESAVWVTTDPARVAGCAALGSRTLADPAGLDVLRGEAVRRGADVLRLTEVSARGISAEFYRCGATTPALPVLPTGAPLRVASPTPTPAPTPAPRESRESIRPRRRSSKTAPDLPTTAERQRAAREELESMKAAILVVFDPKLVDGCEKRGEAKGAGVTEDSLREAAVAALANVVLMRRGENREISGEYFRCSRQQYQRLLAVTPTPPGG